MDLLTAASALPYHQLYFQHFQGMEDNWVIWLFVWAVIVDLMTGTARSLATYHITSTKGTFGLIKHGVLLIIVLTLYPMLDINGMKNAGDTFTMFYVFFYAVSIIENCGQMGLPIPTWLKKYIYKLSDEYNDKRGTDDNEK